ncbi:uncharacterized protein LOC142563418 [Dermacentor variabilis]|uniref:uncharacterized protein LOC142563418 n=1 Tax=Dermacentor variabilis TaxID=34621 RepID=UPI003F5C8CAB
MESVTGETISPEDANDPGWIAAYNRKPRKGKASQPQGASSSCTRGRRRDGDRTAGPNSAYQRLVATSRLPQLPRDTFRIIVRPRDGLNVAKSTPVQVEQALAMAAALAPQDLTEDSICPNVTQNIFIICTPSERNARAYATVQQIRMKDTTYRVAVYPAPPDNTCKGVVRGIDLELNDSQLRELTVTKRNPNAMEVKRIKNTTAVTILFQGMQVPSYIYCGASIVRCMLFRRHTEICYNCGNVSHRADVCPNPSTTWCQTPPQTQPTRPQPLQRTERRQSPRFERHHGNSRSDHKESLSHADTRAPQRPPQQPLPLQGAPYIRPHRTDVDRPSARETPPAAATGRLIYQTGESTLSSIDIGYSTLSSTSIVPAEDMTTLASLDEGHGTSDSERSGGAPKSAHGTPVPATNTEKSFTFTTSGITGTAKITTRSPQPMRFVCTVGPAFAAGIPLPKDGLCTLVFFDSVYAGGSSGLGPTGLAGNVMAFLEWAINSAGGTTQFGVSLAIDDQNLEHQVKTKRFESGISWILGQGIAHFGLLNAYLSYSSPAYINVALKVLKTIDNYLNLRNVRTSSTVMALGVAPVYRREFSSYIELMKQVFMPDLFIAIGHISYSDDGRPDCVIFPPSVYTFPPYFTAPYGHTLEDSVELLRQVQSMPDHPALGLSLSLHGRIYIVRNPEDQNPQNIGTFSVFNSCNSSKIVAPTEICNSQSPQGLQFNYVYNKRLYVAQSYDKASRKTSTFESEEALIAKVCTIKETALALDFNIVAYDIERDSPKTVCNALTLKGSYARLSVLGKLNRFVALSYKTAMHKTDCFTYAISSTF